MKVEEVAKHLGRLESLLEENEALKRKLQYKESIIDGYHLELKDMQDQILNHKGALKRQNDEIHVLYHKISTLVEGFKDDNYNKLGVTAQREALKEIMDTIEPTNVEFTYGGPKYTLKEYGIKLGEDPVSHYPEERLYFC